MPRDGGPIPAPFHPGEGVNALGARKKGRSAAARREPSLFGKQTGKGTGKGGNARGRKRRSGWRGVVYWSFTFSLWAMFAGIGFAIYLLTTLPDETLFRIPEREPGIILLGDDGEILAQRGSFFGDEAIISELPSYVPEAVIATEDRRFASHFGIDPIGLARAMFANLRAGRIVQGGSTITQQLAKNLFLEPDRTMKRKVQEAMLALWLESKFSKDEILQLYLNRVYFGRGAHGIEAAAKHYFDKSARELSLAEAAILTGLLKAPAHYNPIDRPQAAESRAFVVLSNMVREGFITVAQGQRAIDQPAEVVARDYIPATQYIVDWVMRLIPELAGPLDSSIIVHTTIDRRFQDQAERIVRRHLAETGAELNAREAAVVLIDTAGAVKAMVGGRSYRKSQFNRAIRAKRQPGSAFKPFVYLAAMERGLTPDTIVVDEPVRFGDWTPANYNDQYFGAVTARTALARSLNTIAAKLTVEVGPGAVVDVAHRLGIQSDLSANASIALGTSEVTPLELTAAYAPFANGGYGVIPHVVTRIVSRDGRVHYARHGSGLGRVMGERDVGAMNDMLRAAIVEGTARRARLEGQDAAGKTGTSQQWRDAWFVGYTAHYVAGVWVGNDDNTPTRRASGSGLPVAIWKDVMASAHAGLPSLPLPGASPEPEDRPGMSIARFLESLFGGAAYSDAGGRSRSGPGMAPDERHREERNAPRYDHDAYYYR